MVLTLATVALLALQVPPTPVPVSAANRLVVDHTPPAEGYRLYTWDAVGLAWLLADDQPLNEFEPAVLFQPDAGTVQEFHATAYNAVGESGPSPVLRVQWSEDVRACQHFIPGPARPLPDCVPVAGWWECRLYKLPPAGWQPGEPCDSCGWCWR